MSGGMPHTPSGGGCMTPPMSPCPSVRMSMNALRSKLSASARRISGLSKGGASRLVIRLALAICRHQFADRLRRLACDIPQQGHRDLKREGHVKLAGDKGQDRSRAVRYHGIFDAVEVRPIPLPVIEIARHLDVFVRLELDEFERAGADRMLAHFTRRYM